ncbi:hypothetical protein LG284_05440 [Citricoccus nitrophenolicus]
METAEPTLWLDWCEVTGTPVDQRDEPTIDRFARQTQPSQKLLAALRPPKNEHSAPAWPKRFRDDSGTLGHLLRHVSARIQDRDTGWIARLRLRRLLFAAVLIAPTRQGGLALTRDRISTLDPGQLRELRPAIGTAADPDSCPACAVWSWLDVLGTNNGWSHASVRALAHRPEVPTDPAAHRHKLPDPSPDWQDCPGVLPAIDRWGYVDPYASLHPSSISVLINTIVLLCKEPAPVEEPALEPVCSPVPRVTPEEEERILARADELTARIDRLLNEYG